jgi:hypothetical protein
MSFIRPAAFAAAILIATGCSSGGTGGDTTGAAEPTSRRDVITRAELDGSEVSNAYDAIQRLRPAWFRVRGTTSTRGSSQIWVYVDGVRLGELERLRTIPIERIRELRHISASDATIRWGTGHSSGAIEVITRG